LPSRTEADHVARERRDGSRLVVTLSIPYIPNADKKLTTRIAEQETLSESAAAGESNGPIPVIPENFNEQRCEDKRSLHLSPHEAPQSAVGTSPNSPTDYTLRDNKSKEKSLFSLNRSNQIRTQNLYEKDTQTKRTILCYTFPMKHLTTDELRQAYLDFFRSKGHAIIPGAPLVPENDPTVLFTTASTSPLLAGRQAPGRHTPGRRAALRAHTGH